MYVLIIDGKAVLKNEYVRPLIEELRWHAQSSGFEDATIRLVSE